MAAELRNKFVYDLFQDQNARSLPNGLTTELANLFDRAQRDPTIILNPRGATLGFSASGPPPYDSKRLGFPENKIHNEITPPIGLIDRAINPRFYLLGDNAIFLSDQAYEPTQGVSKLLYFAHWLAVALLERHIPALGEGYDHEANCPFDKKEQNANYGPLILHWRICRACTSRITEYQQSTGIGKEFLEATTDILWWVSENANATSSDAHVCDLYSERGFLEPQEIAAFMNRDSVYLRIQYRGDFQSAWSELAPYSAGSMSTATPDITKPSRPTVALVNLRMVRPWSIRGRLGVVTGGDFLSRSRVQKAHHFAYYTALTLLLMEYERREGALPGNLPDGGWQTFETLPMAGWLPSGVLDRLEQSAENDERLFKLLADIKAIVWNIKDAYDGDYLTESPKPPPNPETDVSSRPTPNAPPAGKAESNNPRDALNYRSYANALGDLICHPKTVTPITIGICGPWGQGKTVLQKYISERIEENASYFGHVHCEQVEFNAWKYTKCDQLWAEFYTAVVDKVERSFSWWERLGLRADILLNQHLWLYWASGLVVLLLSIILLYDVQPTSTQLYIQHVVPFAWSDLLTWISGLGGITTITLAIRAVTESVPTQILRRLRIPRFHDILGTQHEMFKSFEIVCDLIRTHPEKRFVVFIDDIDRCQPKDVLQVLEAIKLLLDTENFVFILAMDAKVVRLAVGEHYRFMAKKATERERLGRYYLEKMIQIPFHLPGPGEEDMIALKNQLFEGIRVLPGDVEDVGSASNPEVAKADHPTSVPIPRNSESPQVDKPSSVRRQRSVRRRDVGKQRPQLDLDPKPGGVDLRLEMILCSEEDKELEQLFQEGLSLSPRLMQRFTNVYMLAKHLYQSEYDDAPPPSLLALVLLSVKYPFEIRDALSAVAADPKCTNWVAESKDPVWMKDDQFRENFKQLSQLLNKHVRELDEARRLAKYVGHFNLVLD